MWASFHFEKGLSRKIFIDAAPPHLQRAILIAFYTGLRPGAVEMLSLTWAAVSLESRTILVISAHKGGPARREVPLHPEFEGLLRAWLSADARMPDFDSQTSPIVHYRGKAVRSIKRAWKTALTRSGITRRIRPYDLRHQFVTRALENNADLKTISEIVGSSPRTIVRHYQHVSNRQRRATINAMGGILTPPETGPNPESTTIQSMAQKKGSDKCRTP